MELLTLWIFRTIITFWCRYFWQTASISWPTCVATLFNEHCFSNSVYTLVKFTCMKHRQSIVFGASMYSFFRPLCRTRIHIRFRNYKTSYLYKPESLMTNIMQLSDLTQSPVKDNVFRSYLSNIRQLQSFFIEIDDKAKCNHCV